MCPQLFLMQRSPLAIDDRSGTITENDMPMERHITSLWGKLYHVEVGLTAFYQSERNDMPIKLDTVRIPKDEVICIVHYKPCEGYIECKPVSRKFYYLESRVFYFRASDFLLYLELDVLTQLSEKGILED